MKSGIPFALRHPLVLRRNKLAQANAQWAQRPDHVARYLAKYSAKVEGSKNSSSNL